MPQREPQEYSSFTRGGSSNFNNLIEIHFAKGVFKNSVALFGQTLIIGPIAHVQDLSCPDRIRFSPLANL